MYKLVNSCKKTSELIDKQHMTSLNLKEKVQLYFHKSMCKTCTSYEHQSKFIDHAVGKWLQRKSEPNLDLSTEKKNQILDEINKY